MSVGHLTITGTLAEHRRTKAGSAWAVALLEIDAPAVDHDGAPLPVGARVVAVGPRLALLAEGTPVRLRGAWDDGDHGVQLVVLEQEALGVATPTQAHRWLDRLAGVGPVRARAIQAALGDRVLEVLQDRPGDGDRPDGDLDDPLLAVPGIGPALAARIRASWAELAAQPGAAERRWLDGLGLTTYEGEAVLALARQRGATAEALLRENPYALADEARGFGFARCDRIALKAGCARTAPARVEAAVVHALTEACEADTGVLLGRLVRQTADLAGVEPALALDAALAVVRRGDAVLEVDHPQGRRWVHPAALARAERDVASLVAEAVGRAPEARGEGTR